MDYEIVGFKFVEFTGKNGDTVTGYRLYLTYTAPGVTGVATDTVFIRNLDFVPIVGMRLSIFYNRYGKMVSFTPVS